MRWTREAEGGEYTVEWREIGRTGCEMSAPSLSTGDQHRRRTLLIAALAAGIVLLGWNVPAVEFAP